MCYFVNLVKCESEQLYSYCIVSGFNVRYNACSRWVCAIDIIRFRIDVGYSVINHRCQRWLHCLNHLTSLSCTLSICVALHSSRYRLWPGLSWVRTLSKAHVVSLTKYLNPHRLEPDLTIKLSKHRASWKIDLYVK